MPTERTGTVDPEQLAEFEHSLRGTVIEPDDDEYHDARDIWNGLIDKRPAVIAQCHGTSDVVKTVTFASNHDLDFSILSGGHHQSGSSLVEGGLVIDLSQMDSIYVDADNKTARVEPGCRADDVVAETGHHDLAMPTGSAGDVGIPGSTLQGGIGWIRRKHGLAIDALQSVDVVMPDGELVTASESENEDLFWAIRGGGGNFGVITSFEFELYDVNEIVAGLGVFYPGDEAEAVLEEYRDIVADAPEEITTIALNGHVPHLPPIPDDVAGEEAVAILGCYADDGDPGANMEHLQELREITEPLLDMSEPMPYLLLHDLGTMMFPDGRHYCHRSMFFDELSEDLIEEISTQKQNAPSPLSAIGVWHMGGAVSEMSNTDTVYPYRDMEFMVTVEANWENGSDEENLEWARDADAALRDLGGQGAYGGFTGVSEQAGEDFTDRVYGDNFDRLAELKAKFDENNILDKNVNVSPADD